MEKFRTERHEASTSLPFCAVVSLSPTSLFYETRRVSFAHIALALYARSRGENRFFTRHPPLCKVSFGVVGVLPSRFRLTRLHDFFAPPPPIPTVFPWPPTGESGFLRYNFPPFMNGSPRSLPLFWAKQDAARRARHDVRWHDPYRPPKAPRFMRCAAKVGCLTPFRQKVTYK